MGPVSSQITCNPLPCTIQNKRDRCGKDERHENLLSNAEYMSQRRKERGSLKRQKATSRSQQVRRNNNYSATTCHNSITIPVTFERENEATNQGGQQPPKKSDYEGERPPTCLGSTKSYDVTGGNKFKIEESFNKNKNLFQNSYSNEDNCLAEVNVFRGREEEGIKQLSSFSTFQSNCLKVVGNKNNLAEQTLTSKVMKRRESFSSSSEDDASNSDEEDSPEIEDEKFPYQITKKSTTFNHSRVDDKWVYCHEIGCAFWTRKPERMARHAKCHVPDNKHYQCPDCPLRFYSLAKMLKHDRKVHTGVKDYECRVCDAEVTDIQIHMRVSFNFEFFRNIEVEIVSDAALKLRYCKLIVIR